MIISSFCILLSCRFTLFFIFAPNLYGFLSTLYNRLKFHHRNGAPTLVLLFLDLTFLRMLYDLYHDHAGGTKRMRNLEASFESLPQLFLQVYIIMLGEATPTEFQFLSIVVSIANIGVSYYSLQSDFLRDATEKKIKAPKMFAGFYVFGVFARVGALASYAAAYKFSVFNWLAALWAIELFFSWAWYDKTVLAILSSLVNVLRGRVSNDDVQDHLRIISVFGSQILNIFEQYHVYSINGYIVQLQMSYWCI